MTKVGARVAPGAGDSKLRSEGGPRRGRKEGKKSDKTMERNLNYAPRKMAIVCKAMLIRRGGKGGGRRLRRRRQTQDPVGFFFIASKLFLFFSYPPPSLSTFFIILFFFFRRRPRSLRSRSLRLRRFLRTLRTAFRLLHLSAYFQDVSSHSLSSLLPSRFISAYNCIIARSSYDRRNLR